MVYLDISWNASTEDISDLRIFFWKHVTAEERRALPNYQSNGKTCALLRIASLVIEQPGNVDAERWEDSTGCEPYTSVSGARAMDILYTCKQTIANSGHGSKASYDKPTISAPI